jgi:hypothetical protein
VVAGVSLCGQGGQGWTYPPQVPAQGVSRSRCSAHGDERMGRADLAPGVGRRRQGTVSATFTEQLGGGRGMVSVSHHEARVCSSLVSLILNLFSGYKNSYPSK